MRVVIAGGTGFIGRRLVKMLLQRGFEVVVLSRSVAKVHDIFGHEVGAGVWDGKSGASWSHLADGAKALVNLAGESIFGRWTEDKKRRILESRLNAGQAMVEAVSGARHKPEVLIQGSAVGYYGPRGSQENPVDESAPPGDGFLADVCRAWEPSTAAVEELGVRRAIARTAVVLDKDGGALAMLLPQFKAFLGGHVGDGRQGFPWIHRDDEAGALAFLLEHDECSGVYNLVAPQVVSNAEFAQAVGKAVGRPSWLHPPGFVLKAVMGEMAEEMLLAGQYVRPARLLEAGYAFRFPTLKAALGDIVG